MEPFDLTPDPKVLIALTRTPMQPLDALCELIDNATDAFEMAQLQGNPVEHPIISIELPRLSEVDRKEGVIKIADNGPGLTSDMAEQALRAGYTGNNPYDSLGLFGMGFNISTGKLGIITHFTTKRREQNAAIEAVIDLKKIQETRSFKVQPNEIDNPDFSHGTRIEIRDWWPEGDPNSNFTRKLVQYGSATIRREIGRRYATILRSKNISITINGALCEPFEHCAWADTRYVERRDHGRIYAKNYFNELIDRQKRCVNCTALVPAGNECPACRSSNLRTIEERITGWVGIQRFDHEADFGIDLIRNGRAIRIGEKAAFFEYTDEFKKTIKDYPIDSPYGRIIGEVHLNHVPVDFLKQDFQRSSVEWQRAMLFLRGNTSLQPGKMAEGEKNISPIFMLYQGYRRVRTPGKTDMYMGNWDRDVNKPKRVSRDTEREYYEKFKQKMPGYFDDTEWWKLIERADTPPAEELIACPSCSNQNLQGHDICAICGYILIGKTCINSACGSTIPRSATLCPHCGGSQIPEIKKAWICSVCENRNSADYVICGKCSAPQGSLNPLSRDYLIKHSYKSDDLSIEKCSIKLADESYSRPVDVNTYVTNMPLLAHGQSKPIPLVTFKGESIEIFIDSTHSLFKVYQIRSEQMIAAEVALYLYDTTRHLSGYRGQHSLSNLERAIIEERWGDKLADSAEQVRNDIHAFFNELRERLPGLLGETAKDFFEDLDEEQKKHLVENIMGQGLDVSGLSSMRTSGTYLRYLDTDTVIEIFKREPSSFFDGNFWKETYVAISELPTNVIEQVQARVRTTYLNCLEDAARFLKYSEPESIVTRRARASLGILQQKMI